MAIASFTHQLKIGLPLKSSLEAHTSEVVIFNQDKPNIGHFWGASSGSVNNAEGDFAAENSYKIILENSWVCIFPKIEIVSMKGISIFGLPRAIATILWQKPRAHYINEASMKRIKKV
jgi:hypothetical protein